MSDTFFPICDPDFDAPRPRSPIAANADPVTSHLAAAEVTASGQRDTECEKVLAALKRHGPGITSLELSAQERELGRHTIARRLPDLERQGKVKRTGQRVCLVGRRLAVTWEALP